MRVTVDAEAVNQGNTCHNVEDWAEEEGSGHIRHTDQGSSPPCRAVAAEGLRLFRWFGELTSGGWGS